jgi:Calcium binding
VPRKKKKRQPQAVRPSAPATPLRFDVGDSVRVKSGFADEDYPDIPLGGWSGLVSEVDPQCQPPMYLIQWNIPTLENIHPIYIHRCQRDGFEHETLWLDEDRLEPNTGDGVPMEQPATILPRPLQPYDQSDRIRAVLGLTSDEPLPAADKEQLRKYHQFLSDKLSFPFNAEIWVQSGPFQGRTHLVTVYRLLDVTESGVERNGLMVEGGYEQERLVMPLCDLETSEDSPNRRMVQDYTYWFSAAGNEFDESAAYEDASPMSPATVWKSLLRATVYGMGLGAVLGALLATQGEAALYGMYMGAGLLAVMGWLFGSRYGLLLGAVNRVKGGPLLGGILGVAGGAIVGSAAAVLLVGYLGTIPGSIVANLLGKVSARLGWKPVSEVIWTLVGACTGGMILALAADPDKALTGAMAGVLLGGVMTAIVFLFVVVSLGLMLNTRS